MSSKCFWKRFSGNSTPTKKYIDTEQPIIVVVGDAAVVAPQLETLGEVVVVDNEGNVVE
jgi:hypothetical protein